MSWSPARRLFHPVADMAHAAEEHGRRAASICVASGKGGVGKSVFSASLATLLARRGRTLIVDADMGIGNAHILQGVSPERTFVDVVLDDLPVEEVVVGCGPRLDLVAAGSGVSSMAGLTAGELQRIAEGLARLEEQYAYLLVDSAAGVSNQTVSFAAGCDQVLLITTPDVTSMTDAYAFLKVLFRGHPDARPLLAVNRARDEAEAHAVAERMEQVSQKFLGRAARWIGWVPEDAAVSAAVNARAPVARYAPGCGASRALIRLAARVREDLARRTAGGLGHRLRGPRGGEA